MKAIVYTSCTGHTKAYAEMLGKKTGLPVYALRDALKTPDKGAEIIYLGWLRAGSLQGYKQAVKNFKPVIVCAVGMSEVETQRADILKQNGIPEETPLFCLQGGFEMEKLSGMNKFMMKCMRAVLGKRLQKKTDRTPAEEEQLEMLLHGKNCVSEEELSPVLDRFETDFRG